MNIREAVFAYDKLLSIVRKETKKSAVLPGRFGGLVHSFPSLHKTCSFLPYKDRADLHTDLFRATFVDVLRSYEEKGHLYVRM